MSKLSKFEQGVLTAFLKRIEDDAIASKLEQQMETIVSIKRYFGGRRILFSSKFLGIERRKEEYKLNVAASPLYIGEMSLAERSTGVMSMIWIRTVNGYLNDITIDSEKTLSTSNYDHSIADFRVRCPQHASRQSLDPLRVRKELISFFGDPDFPSESSKIRTPWEADDLPKVALSEGQLPSDWKEFFSLSDGFIVDELDVFELTNISKEIIADKVVTWMGATPEGTYLYFDPSINQMFYCEHDSKSPRVLSDTIRASLRLWNEALPERP